jgi:hypothetical protein
MRVRPAAARQRGRNGRAGDNGMHPTFFSAAEEAEVGKARREQGEGEGGLSPRSPAPEQNVSADEIGRSVNVGSLRFRKVKHDP